MQVLILFPSDAHQSAISFQVFRSYVRAQLAPVGCGGSDLRLGSFPILRRFRRGEEIGWRGYALPRPSSVIGLPVASIVLGVVWACWHLPFFFLSGTDKSGQSFPVYLLAVTAVSIAMAWLYWRTEGSLLLVMLMHSAVNNTNILPTPRSTNTNPFTLRTSLVSWLSAVLLWLCGGYFLVRMERR